MRDPAFEKVAITWNRMLRALSTRSRTDMVRDRDEDAADDEQEARVAEPYRFQSLIEDKTDGFVGREYVYDAIDAFLSRHENGYFIVQGDPGIGKSVILAEYVRTHRCIAHFNVRSQGNNRGESVPRGRLRPDHKPATISPTIRYPQNPPPTAPFWHGFWMRRLGLSAFQTLS